jgi:hypothetical protein
MHKFLTFAVQIIRRGVRVVERASLESLYTRKGIAGSNPALSAFISFSYQMNVCVHYFFFLRLFVIHCYSKIVRMEIAFLNSKAYEIKRSNK